MEVVVEESDPINLKEVSPTRRIVAPTQASPTRMRRLLPAVIRGRLSPPGA